MLILDLEWLTPVTRIRSDRWLEFYIQYGNDGSFLDKKSKAEKTANLALTDHQFYQENMHRRDDNHAANEIWGSGHQADAVLKQLQLMQQKLLTWQGNHFAVNAKHLNHWSALIAKVDPVWLLAIGYSDKLKQSSLQVTHVIKLAEQQCFAAFPKQFNQKQYADNHVHLGGNGNYTPALAEISLFLKNKPTVFNNSNATGPKLAEFTKYASGERDVNELPVLTKLLFNDLLNTLLQTNKVIKNSCSKIDWQQPKFWSIPDESASELLATQALNNDVVKLLNAAINCCHQDSNKMWLLIATALIHHANTNAACDHWLYKFNAYVTSNNILRSMMISTGVGLTSFVEHFSFKARQGNDQIIPYGVHSYNSDFDENTLREFKILDLQVTAKNLARYGLDFFKKNKYSNKQFTFHFSRSLKKGQKSNDSRYTTKRTELLKSLRNLQNVFSSSSLQQHKYLQLGSKKVTKLNLIALVRGIDVAGNENDLPIEVFAPTIRLLRAGLFYPDHHEFIPQRKLHLSVHAGEDFSHILTGLRTIDETVEFCDYQVNDRIGHALALGVNVKQWAKRQQRAYVPVRSHLDNLVWAHHYAIEVIKTAPQFYAVLAILERKIAKWSHHLFGKEVSKYTLFEAWSLRKNCPEYFDTEFKSRSEETKAWLPDNQSKLKIKNDEAVIFWQKHTDSGINKTDEKKVKKTISIYFGDNPPPFINDKYSELVDTSELDFYEALQDYLIEKYSDKGIIIEACPTSNIYIGRFKCYSEHPVYRWYPAKDSSLNVGEKFNRFGIRKGPITVCINTDDAGLMPTTIENEHRILKETAINHFNIGSETAECWIDRLREIGVEVFKSNYIDSRK
ncbi:hypothetical protein [Pseudocolwellia sp. HL-MZ7]|uniref:hypothetical protein n=1 Tax=Pseudocolwellia sp. HL-MZ7 TaxID=3400627 RepID=UPI003CF1EBBF